MAKLTPHQALIHVMVTMSAADQLMSNAELATVGDIIKTAPFFDEYDSAQMVDDVQTCGDMLQEDDGIDTIVANLKESIDPKYYATAYAFAVEVAAADLSANQQELRFLQILRDELDIDRLTASAIERGARARYIKLS